VTCCVGTAVEAAVAENWKEKYSRKLFVSDYAHICCSESAAWPDTPMALASS
jgi:hypothetical protein